MHRPTSIQARYTLLVTLVSAVLLGVGAIALDLAVRNHLADGVYRAALRQARRVADLERAGTLPNPIPVTVPHTDLIQVVDAQRRVVAASRAAAGRPVLSGIRPAVEDRVASFNGCPWPGTCVLGVATRASMDPDSPVVYAAQERPTLLSGPLLELAIGGLLALALAGIARGTWRLVGNTLKPVNEIRRELAEITGTDVTRRVPETPGDDEIARLARAANATLDRLEGSVRRQRGFASDASHELRTPIAGMRAQIEAALMFPEDTDHVATLRAIQSDLNRLEAIVTDLLLLARLGTEATGEHERVQLGKLIAYELSRRPPERVPVHAELDPRVPVNGARLQLARLFTNLIDNAERHADSQVTVIVAREGDQAVLEVLDDGAGIEEAERERVFERFTRLDVARSRDTGGTGLGLALVRDIATVHGGTVTIEPSERGARFVVRIPLAG